MARIEELLRDDCIKVSNKTYRCPGGTVRILKREEADLEALIVNDYVVVEAGCNDTMGGSSGGNH